MNIAIVDHEPVSLKQLHSGGFYAFDFYYKRRRY